jgi:adhesin transport system membrane fusion protein
MKPSEMPDSVAATAVVSTDIKSFAVWGLIARLFRPQRMDTNGSVKGSQLNAALAKRVQFLREGNAQQALHDQLSDVYLLRLQPPSRMLRHGLWLTALTLLILLVWAATTTLDEVTTGIGKVIPSSREQVIQAIDAGVVAEVLVHEGEIVEVDQPLVRIDDVRMGASMQESQARINGLQAAAVRLRAEAQGSSLVFPQDLRKRNPDLVRSEEQTYRARRQSLDTSVYALQQSLKVALEEMQLTEPLAAKGLVSEIDVLRIQRSVAEMRGRMSELQAKYRAEAAAELARIESELGSQSATLLGRSDAVRRAVLRAPKRGIVKNIRVTTEGGFVQAGQDVLEIVPVDDSLLVETRIRPTDIAFLRPGLPATVKLTAYDVGVYGWLEGELLQISPDTLRDEVRRDETYYKVIVRTSNAGLKTREGKSLPVIPGMQAYVDIKTGQKSVLSYLFKPVLRAREALRER